MNRSLLMISAAATLQGCLYVAPVWRPTPYWPQCTGPATCDVDLLIDVDDLAQCYGSAGNLPAEFAHCDLGASGTQCQVDVATYNDYMDTYLQRDALGLIECCVLQSDDGLEAEEIAEHCCNGEKWFERGECTTPGKDEPCVDDAQQRIEDLLEDCPWMDHQDVVDCDTEEPFFITPHPSSDPDDGIDAACDDKDDSVYYPQGVANFDAQIDPSLSYVRIDWADGTFSTSPLSGNLLTSTQPATFLMGFGWAPGGPTPQGQAEDLFVHFIGPVTLTTSGTNFLVDAEDDYGLRIMATVSGQDYGWEMDPQDDAMGQFDTSAGTWFLDASEPVPGGHVVTVHVEGGIISLP